MTITCMVCVAQLISCCVLLTIVVIHLDLLYMLLLHAIVRNTICRKVQDIQW